MSQICNCLGCGSSATFVENPKRPGFGRVQCVLCGLRTEGGEARDIAVAGWNRVANNHDRRVTELLASNNALLFRARDAEARLKAGAGNA